jgi:hypothetical protein
LYTTLYIYSVVLYSKYTGAHQNDFTAHRVGLAMLAVSGTAHSNAAVSPLAILALDIEVV